MYQLMKDINYILNSKEMDLPVCFFMVGPDIGVSRFNCSEVPFLKNTLA